MAGSFSPQRLRLSYPALCVCIGRLLSHVVAQLVLAIARRDGGSPGLLERDRLCPLECQFLHCLQLVVCVLGGHEDVTLTLHQSLSLLCEMSLVSSKKSRVV